MKGKADSKARLAGVENALNRIAESTREYVDGSRLRMETVERYLLRTTQNMGQLAQSMTRLEGNMDRLERNLDALIQAITSGERTNGRKK